MRTIDSPWHLADGVRATVPHRLPSGHVVQLWRPGPPPHLDGWYEPALAFVDLVRQQVPHVELDPAALLYLGRVDGPSGPRWLYRHVGGAGEVLLDIEGRPARPVADGRRRAGFRFVPGSTLDACLDLGLDEVPLATVLPFRRRG